MPQNQKSDKKQETKQDPKKAPGKSIKATLTGWLFNYDFFKVNHHLISDKFPLIRLKSSMNISNQ